MTDATPARRARPHAGPRPGDHHRRRHVLDTWYPAPPLGAPAGDGRTPELAALEGARPAASRRRSSGRVDLDAAAGRRPRRLPAPAPALAPAGPARTTSTWTASSACWPTSSGPSSGPCAVDDFERTRLRLRRRAARSRCFGVDKFPRMVDYVVPAGVRIADADRVRLGAHLAAGTTVMHEGFVNFNAGTLGTSMVEGRISAGVVVGDGSDVGGGASIMGTLSGGGKDVVSIGGAACRRERRHRHQPRRRLRRRGRAVRDGGHQGAAAGAEDRWSRPRELSGVASLLFRRNSVTGAIEARPAAGQRRGAQRGAARQRLTDALTRDLDRRHRTRPPARADPGAGAAGGRASPLARRCWLAAGRLARGAAPSDRRRPHCTATALGEPSSTPSRPATRRSSPPSPCSAGCRRGPRPSASPPPCRSRSSSTSTAATATPSGCSSSALARAGARRPRSATRSTRPTRSTTCWSRSRATRTCRSPTARRRCSARRSPPPTPTTSPRRAILASALTGHSPAGLSCGLDARRRRARAAAGRRAG